MKKIAAFLLSSYSYSDKPNLFVKQAKSSFLKLRYTFTKLLKYPPLAQGLKYRSILFSCPPPPPPPKGDIAIQFKKCIATYSFLSLSLLFLLCITAQAQSFQINGKVKDAKTKENLAFVNIIINQQVTQGTTTDIDGKFDLNSDEPIRELSLIYIGYKTKTISVEGEDFLSIEMEQDELMLGEIVVIAGENPAHRIIRKAVQNKRINNPEKVRSFKYTSYNKFVANTTFDSTQYIQRRVKGRNAEKDQQTRIDATSAQANFDQYHLMILESVTERIFIRPDKSEETVLASRVSGLQNPAIVALATDIQPFSFYKSHIPLLGKDYINPISRGSTQFYRFRLEEDTLFRQQDTIFVISFQPKKKANFEGLKGVLYINTNRYAVQNVIAEPAQINKAHLKIEQQYSFVQEQWFPSQLNFEVQWHGVPLPSTDMYLNGKSYFKDIEIEPDISRKDFGIDAVVMPPEAIKKQEDYWAEARIEPLTQKEKQSYQFVDSIGKEANLDALTKLSENLITNNQIQFGKVAVDLPRLLNNNNYEGTRIGLGLHSSDAISRFISLGGYVGYGTKDKAWKYGADFRLRHPDSRYEPEIKLEYFNDLREPGLVYQANYPVNYVPSPATFQRGLQAERLDSIQRYSVSVGVRPIRYMKLQLGGSHSQQKSLYTNPSLQDSIGRVSAFSYTAFHANARYAFKEQYIKLNGRRVPSLTPFPVLNVFYTKGLPDVLDGQLDFHRLVVALEADFKLKRLGQTFIWLEGGMVRGDTPYPLLFNGNGSRSSAWEPFFVANTFQTMGLYEFLGDRFANLFVYHNFGTLLFRTQKFRPDIIFAQGIGFSTLSAAEGENFDTLDKGYYESGLALDNLIRINVLNLGYLGLGAGVFYRYGHYKKPKEIDNYAFKLRAGFSF